MGQNLSVATILIKSACVLAVYTICMLMLLSCCSGICEIIVHCWSNYKIIIIIIIIKDAGKCIKMKKI